jgi:Phage terminase large subunit
MINNVLRVEPTTVADPEHRPYKPHGAIFELFRTRQREVCLEGPSDTGKSRGCLEKLNALMLKYPGARGAIIRQTRSSMTATAMATFERFVLPPGAAKLWGNEQYRYANGSVIYLFGCDDVERLKSAELDFCYVQEITELSQDDFEVVTSRVTGRGSSTPYVQLMADCNPSAPRHWLYQREASGTMKFIFAKHEDNPSITPERLAALDSLTGYRYQRLRLGLRVAAEGMFFGEWNPELHVVDPIDIPEDWPRWVAVDYGFGAPWCALWLTRDKPGGHIYVYRERYAPGLRDEQQAAEIIRASEAEAISLTVLDPSMFNPRTEQQRPSIAQVYASAGCINLVPGHNARKQGWAVMRRALAHDDHPPRLQIMRGRAPNLERTIPQLVVDSLDPEDVADKIGSSPAEDHAADALRYGLCAEAQPVEPTQSEDMRWGR